MPQAGFDVSGSELARPDSEAEFTEGYLYYLKIDTDDLDEDDRDRIMIRNQVVLVSIQNNDRK